MNRTRRGMLRLLLGAPVAAAAATSSRASGPQIEPQPPPVEDAGPSPLSRFLAKQDPHLSGAEKRRVRRDVTQLEEALQEVRDFALGNDAPPSSRFAALRSGTRHRPDAG